MKTGGSRQSIIKARRICILHRSPTRHQQRGCESLNMTTEPQTHVLDLPNAFAELTPLISFLNGARSQPIEIDCNKVAMMPSRCLQVLLGAEQQWRSEGLGFSVTNINDGCRRALSLLGLETNRFEDEDTA